ASDQGCDGTVGLLDADTTIDGVDAGAATDDDTEWRRIAGGINASSYSFDPSAEGLAIGQSVAIAVTAIDRSGNESERSAPACVTRILTSGFCAEHGQCESCSVRAPGTRNTSP